MSREDFIKYRLNSSYRLPSPIYVKQYPYGVVKDGVYGRYFTGLGYYNDDIVDKTKEALIALIEALYTKEKQKERDFLMGLKRELKVKDPDFYNKYEKLVLDDDSFSKFFSLYKARKNELLDLKLDYQQQLKSLSEQWHVSQNQAFLRAINNAITGGEGGIGKKSPFTASKDGFLNMTFEDIIKNAQEIFMNEINEEVSEEFKKVYAQVWQKTEEEIIQRLGEKGFNKKNQIKNYHNKLVKDGFDYKFMKVHIGGGKYKKREKATVGALAQKIIEDMLLNGSFAETFLTINSNGKKSSAINKPYNSFLGNKGEGAIQTDIVELFSADITLQNKFKEEFDRILENNKNEVYQKINDLINFYSQDNFIVQYSSKDYFFEELEGQSTDKRVHIRKDSSFDSRLEEIKGIYEDIPFSNRKDINNLIFEIVNLHKGLVAEDKKNEVREQLSAVCVAWMFEDYKETFRQVKTNTKNKRIHCYFINGQYYLLSNILRRIIDKLKDEESNAKLVSISISTSKKDIYEEMRKNKKQFQGIERWDEVRNMALKEGKIGLRMNVGLLEQMLLNI